MGERRTQASGALLPRPHQNIYYARQYKMPHSQYISSKAKLQLALKALKQDATLSIQRARALYKVAKTTL
jgi:hypothetical protein